MRILDIEKLFASEDTLDKVLEECKETFERIDYYATNMKQGITNNPEEAKNALNELTGLYMTLKTISVIAETEKKNREIKHYNTRRIDIENEGSKKFTSAPMEKEASNAVASYRRIRNIILGYISSVEKAISTLQSLLKFMGEEMKLQK